MSFSEKERSCDDCISIRILREQLKDIRENLKTIEWEGENWSCPICNTPNKQEHLTECWLSNAIKG